MPLVLIHDGNCKGSGSGSGGGGGGTTFANASILSKISETPDGKLVYNGKIIGEASTLENADLLKKFSVDEKGELLFDGQPVGKMSEPGILSKFSVDEDGNLLFDGKVIGECNCDKAISAEVTHYVTLAKGQTVIELPGDCDISQAIVLSLNGVILEQDVFWKVVERNYPEKDFITWDGLELETLAQEGDSILITYYRDGQVLRNKATTEEVTHYVTLAKGQKTIELPNDCDTSQAIVLLLNGIAMNQGTFWEVIEKDSPEKDLISWNGLELEKLAQEGDSILITYYRKV